MISPWKLHSLFRVTSAGRSAEKLSYVTQYLKAVGMFRDYSDADQDPEFTQVPHQSNTCLIMDTCTGMQYIGLFADSN